MSGLFINTDISSLIARKQISRTVASMNNTLTQLSTGYKINSAKDDPAGLIASTILNSDIAATNQAIKNTQRANSVLSIAESGMSAINGLLNEARVLAVEAANTGAMTPEQIAANQQQMDAILQSVDRITRSTKYLDKQLLTGDNAVFQLGADVVSSQQYGMKYPNTGTADVGNSTGMLTDIMSGGSASLKNNPAAASSILESAISSISFSRGRIGTVQKSTFDPNIAVLQDTMVQLSAAEADISNTDYAVAVSNLARSQLLLGTSTMALGIAGQNQRMIASLIGG